MRKFLVSLIRNTSFYKRRKQKQYETYNRAAAFKLAATSKRLDIVAAQVAQNLHLGGYTNKRPFAGKSVLEIGSGWVLSHSIIFWLLGAKKIISVDIEKLFRPDALKQAFDLATVSAIRDLLAPFEDHEKIRERLEYLTGFDFSDLSKVNIDYRAPLDLAQTKIPESVDIIFSASTLEHVPVKDISLLLSNLKTSLTSNGFMLHLIHLEDHKNIDFAPFEFYTMNEFTLTDENLRGNRVRLSGWENYFNALGLKNEYLYKWKRDKKLLPEEIVTEIKYKDEIDLLTSHVAVLSTKEN